MSRIVMQSNPLARAWWPVLCFGLLAGCASSGVKNPSGIPVTQMGADERGFVAGTGVESQDLVAVADKMARSILAIPEIASAKAPPRIVVEPVVNDTRFPINKEIFLTRIRAQLNSKALGRVRFLDRDMLATLERERQMQLDGRIASEGGEKTVRLKPAEYFLAGKLQSISTKTTAGISDYVLYAFRLTDAQTSEIVWEDSVEIKKQGLEDAVYR